MATYSAGCSAVGGYSYADNFTLYVILSERNVSTSGNSSIVDYNVYCQSSGSGSISANHWKYFALNGQQIVNQTVKVSASSPNAYISIASGSLGPIGHNSDGSKSVAFEAQIAASSYGVSAAVSGNFTLTKIGRYTTITSFSVANISGVDGLTKVKFNWTASDACDYAWYSKNNGSSWTALPANNIVTGLTPNTSYNFKLRVRRTDSQLTTDSGTKTKSTYDIARLNNISEFNLGDNPTIGYNNASGSAISMAIFKESDLSGLCNYRSCSGTSYTFNFTDEELDRIYKNFGNSEQLQVRIVLKTADNSSYTDYKTVTINLTGNQKTGHIKLNNEWKRSKRWIKVNDTWRRAVRWIKINDTWQRCI